jgi:hypothetical protein
VNQAAGVPVGATVVTALADPLDTALALLGLVVSGRVAAPVDPGGRVALVRWDGLAHRWPGTGWVDPDATARLLVWRFLTSRPA